MQIAVFGIDLGKNICSLAGIDGSGLVVVRRRVRRENVFKIVSQLKPETVAMEPASRWRPFLPVRASASVLAAVSVSPTASSSSR